MPIVGTNLAAKRALNLETLAAEEGRQSQRLRKLQLQRMRAKDVFQLILLLQVIGSHHQRERRFVTEHINTRVWNFVVSDCFLVLVVGLYL